MRKLPNSRWIKQHTIATTMNGHWYSSEGLVAVVDGDQAGVVGYSCDSYYGIEDGINLTQQPFPEQLFDIPEYVNPWDYITRTEYVNHPKIANFSPEIDWLWEGTREELFYAAKNNTDLMFPSRKLVEADVDYKDMTALYAEIRKSLSRKERKKKQKSKRRGEGNWVEDDYQVG